MSVTATISVPTVIAGPVQVTDATPVTRPQVRAVMLAPRPLMAVRLAQQMRASWASIAPRPRATARLTQSLHVAAASQAPRPKCAVAMAFPLGQLRATLTDVALTAIWTRDTVRLNGAATVAAVDDARAATTTGRAMFPGISGQNVDCGIPTTFNGAAQAAWSTRFTYPGASASYGLIGVYADAGSNNFLIDIESGTMFFSIGGADGSLVSPWAVGDYVEVLWNFDGTQGTNATRLTLAYRIYAWTSHTWGAWSTPALTFAGTIPAVLPNNPGSIHLRLGSWSNGTTAPLKGLLGRTRAWVGQTVSTGQIDGATPGATFDYKWAGGYTNSGSAGHAFDGTAGSGVAIASDDLSYAPPQRGGGGTANPTMTTGADGLSQMSTDGVAQYTMAELNALFDLSGAKSLALIGAINSATGQKIPMGISESANNVRLLGVATNGGGAATVNGIRNADGQFAGTVAVSSTRRLWIISKDASTGVALDVPTATRTTGTNTATAAGNNGVTVGGSFASNLCQAVDWVAALVLSRQVTPADITALKAYAATYNYTPV